MLLFLVVCIFVIFMFFGFFYLIFVSDMFISMVRRMGSIVFLLERIRLYIENFMNLDYFVEYFKCYISYVYLVGIEGDFVFMEYIEV